MSVFHFKKFTIFQDKTPLRITSDACVFGSWISVENATKILDIGTGTGLLALMLAQRSEAEIHAVEMETNAFEQASENFSQSIYNQQIKPIKSRIQDYAETSSETYDLIISNPPFFQNSLKSTDILKNNAKHTDNLTFSDLAKSAQKLLTSKGRFAVILPVNESLLLRQELAKRNLFPSKIASLRHSEKHTFHRHLSIYQSDKQLITEEIIDMKNIDGKTDSTKLISLLKAYYLYL